MGESWRPEGGTMHRRFRRMRDIAMILAPVVMLALCLTWPAAAEDPAAPDQSTAIERLVRQEDARAAELARFEAIARQKQLWATLGARERAMVAGHETVPVATPSGDEAFAWGAAALGLGAGIASMCALLGCLTLVRNHGRLRSV